MFLTFDEVLDEVLDSNEVLAQDLIEILILVGTISLRFSMRKPFFS